MCFVSGGPKYTRLCWQKFLVVSRDQISDFIVTKQTKVDILETQVKSLVVNKD